MHYDRNLLWISLLIAAFNRFLGVSIDWFFANSSMCGLLSPHLKAVLPSFHHPSRQPHFYGTRFHLSLTPLLRHLFWALAWTNMAEWLGLWANNDPFHLCELIFFFGYYYRCPLIHVHAVHCFPNWFALSNRTQAPWKLLIYELIKPIKSDSVDWGWDSCEGNTMMRWMSKQ